MSNGITCSHGEDRCLTCHPLLDARGVEISPGDAVIYGFGVSRSVAMAEGVVVGSPCQDDGCEGIYDDCSPKVSLTPSGLVRIRVVRRSYSSGSKPVVNLMPDRIVVLKEVDGPLQPTAPDPCFALPVSPLPTQDEAHRQKLEGEIAPYTAGLRATEAPSYWRWGGGTVEERLADYLAYCAKRLTSLRKELEALDG